MELVCPHCHSPIECLPRPDRGDVTCPSCGSTFQLESGVRTLCAPAEERRTLGKFELMEPVGIGAFGTVYKARDTQLDRVVAIKIPRSGNFVSSDELDRFFREARSVAQLRHTSIVAVHEVGQDDGVPYLVSDFVEGVTLADVSTARRFTPRQAAELIAEVADALHYAHQNGVVHRDIKPSNIMLDSANRAHVMDFGLAKRDAGEVTMTVEGQLLGTPAYMSPEQARGEGHRVDGRSDVYSLGVILYQLITGELPFRGNQRMLLHQVLHDEPKSPRSLNDRLPRPLETTCLKAMAKEPSRRYGSAGEFAEDLRRFLTNEPILARPAGTWERGWRWARRRPAVAALIAVSVVAAAAILVVGLVFDARLRTESDAAKEARHQAEELRDSASKADRQASVARRAADDANRTAQQKVREADSLRLIARSAAYQTTNPGVALLLAVEGARRGPRSAAENNALEAALQTCRERRTIVGTGVPFWRAGLSTDGRRLATVAGLSTIQIWDVATGRQIAAFESAMPQPSIALNGDGSRLLTIADGFARVIYSHGPDAMYTDRVARLWDADTGRELAVLRGHDDHVASAHFSPDGSRIVTASYDGTARLWQTRSGKLLHILRHPPASLVEANFTPDGRRVFTISAQAKQTTPPLAPPPGVEVDPPTRREASRVKSVTMASRVLLPESDEAMVRLWDVRTGRQVSALNAPWGDNAIGYHTERAQISPDGRWLAVVLGSRLASVWDLRVTERVCRIQGAVDPEGAIHFQTESQRLLTLANDGIVHAWDISTGKELRTLALLLPGKALGRPDLSADGRHALLIGSDRAVHVYDTRTGQEISSLQGHAGRIALAMFVANNRDVVTMSADGTARLWNAVGALDMALVLSTGGEEAWDAIYSPDGRWVAARKSDNSVNIWDAGTGKTRALLHVSSEADVRVKHPLFGPLGSVAFSPDSKTILTVWPEPLGRYQQQTLLGLWQSDKFIGSAPVRVWDASSGKLLTVLPGPKDHVRRAQFSPDGRRILILSSGQRYSAGVTVEDAENVVAPSASATIWDLATARVLLSLPGAKRPMQCAVFSPDGRLLLTSDSETHLLRMDGSLAVQLKGAGTAVDAVFNPDGKRVLTIHRAAAWGRNAASLWDTTNGTRLAELKEHTDAIMSAAYNGDGSRIVTVSLDHTARIWDNHGHALAVLAGHEQGVLGALFSPDSRWIATASLDETARIWDAVTGREFVTLTGHHGPVNSVMFSRDSKRLLTSSADGTVRIWPVDPLPMALERLPRELTREERRRFEIDSPRITSAITSSRR